MSSHSDPVRQFMMLFNAQPGVARLEFAFRSSGLSVDPRATRLVFSCPKFFVIIIRYRAQFQQSV